MARKKIEDKLVGGERKNKGFGMTTVTLMDTPIVIRIDSMMQYIFNIETSLQVFCIFCGGLTHHGSGANPDKLCINACCLEHFN